MRRLSFDLELLEVRALYLLYVLVVPHDHELIETAGDEDGCRIEFEWRCAEFLDHGTCSEEQET